MSITGCFCRVVVMYRTVCVSLAVMEASSHINQSPVLLTDFWKFLQLVLEAQQQLTHTLVHPPGAELSGHCHPGPVFDGRRTREDRVIALNAANKGKV